MSNIFFNYLLLITRGSPLSLLNNPNVELIHFYFIILFSFSTEVGQAPVIPTPV